MQGITIAYLKDYAEHIPLLAKWMFETWGHYNPQSSLKKAEIKLKQHLNTNSLPQTYIALLESKPVGMYSLRENDGLISNLTPWLGSLFVHNDYRNQGIGKLLINHAVEKTKKLEFQKIYLLAFDPTIPLWYRKLGWAEIGIDKLYNNPVTIMSKTTHP